MKSVLLLTVFLSFFQLEKQEIVIAEPNYSEVKAECKVEVIHQEEVLPLTYTHTAIQDTTYEAEVITNDYLFANGNMAVMSMK